MRLKTEHTAQPQNCNRKYLKQCKGNSRKKTILNLSSQISVTLLVIIIEAHLENLAQPGTFGWTVKTLMRKNNLPEIEMSDDAPSAAIFGAMTSNPTSTTESRLYQSSSNSKINSNKNTQKKKKKGQRRSPVKQQQQHKAQMRKTWRKKR